MFAKTFIIASVFSFCIVTCRPIDDSDNSADQDDDFEQFKRKFNKSYSNGRDANERRALFRLAKDNVDRHNRRRDADFQMELNEFSDMSPEEFKSQKLGLVMPSNPQVESVNAILEQPVVRALPASLDWRTSGAVSAVKNQGSCGSCWAFTATGALESRRKIKTGSLLNLSEQNLMDCSYSFGNNACSGGWMNSAFKYVKSVGGINSGAAYPYTAKSSTVCKFNNASSAKYATLATSSGYVSIQSGNETAMRVALQSGPIAIAFNVLSSFSAYKSGVYSDPNCGTSSVNHGMLIVGYGVDSASQKPFWIVKNSWGSQWGDAGYIRVRRGVNMCAIEKYASYPVLL